MTHLTQKTFTAKKEVFIESDNLLIRTKNIREDLEYRIRFEELGFDTVKKRVKTANIPFYIFLLFDVLYASLLIGSMINHETFDKQLFWVFALLLFLALTVLVYYSRNKDVIFLTGGQTVLELFAAKPDHDTVKGFIDSIHSAMRKHFKDKFSKFDSDTPYEFRVNQLKWLKEIKALTEPEYEEMIGRTKTDSIIGFQRPLSED